jgi:hypothetical protein
MFGVSGKYVYVVHQYLVVNLMLKERMEIEQKKLQQIIFAVLDIVDTNINAPQNSVRAPELSEPQNSKHNCGNRLKYTGTVPTFGVVQYLKRTIKQYTI